MKIKIGNKKCIGDGCPPFIIAEAGINHNGDVDIAKKMIEVAKECGADAIKFQTFKADEFIANPDEIYTYYSQGKKVVESMFEMFKRYEFSKKQWKEIIAHCKSKNIVFLTTPQNASDLDLILGLTNLSIIKVGADDLTNLILLKYYASKRIPMIISAGMAYASEIEDAVNTIRNVGNDSIIVLHCVSSYPADAEEINLKKMGAIKDSFGVTIGFSDHSIGITASVGAVASGAKVIEKHFTLDKNLKGPDHWFSANPQELKELVKSIRFIEKALGFPELIPTTKETDMRKICRRSLVAVRNLKKGLRLSETDIAYKRPGTGIAPKFAPYILGRRLKTNINKNNLILLEHLD